MKIILLFISISFLMSCKKNDIPEVIHSVQFQSNINTVGTYSLTINGVSSTIENDYKLKSNVTVSLTLLRTDSTKWLTGTIYLDGKADKSAAGYKDAVLTLTTK